MLHTTIHILFHINEILRKPKDRLELKANPRLKVLMWINISNGQSLPIRKLQELQIFQRRK